MQNMLQRSFSFLVVCLLMFYGEIFSQQTQENTHKNQCEDSMQYNKCWNPVKWKLSQRADDIVQRGQSTVFLRPLTASYYTDQLGFVCKKEWQLEKLISIPFRFRLGSLEYVNWIERKPNAIKPGSH